MVQEEKLCDEVETVGEYWIDSGGILERQWYRKKSYVMKWRQWGNIGETVVQEEMLCDEVETVGEYWRDSGGNIGETVVQYEKLCYEVETVGEYWRDSGAGRKVML